MRTALSSLFAILLAGRESRAQPPSTTASTTPAPEADRRSWSVEVSAYLYAVPDQPDFLQTTFSVDVTCEGIAKPTLLHKVEPEYPTIARLSRIPGNVTVQAVIGRDGNVEDAEIVSSSNRLFDEAALEAVRQWRYAPAMLNGRPVRVTFRVHVEFTLN